MKNFHILLYLILCPLLFNGQAIINGEYFFNTDPGVNNGTSLGGISPTSNFDWQKSISTLGLSDGTHRLGVRFLDSNGAWSHTKTYHVIVQDTSLSQIIGAEYFFGNVDPGIGMGEFVGLNPSNFINHFESISLDTFLSGSYYITWRFLDRLQRWSHNFTQAFSVCQIQNVELTADKDTVCLGDSIHFSANVGGIHDSIYSFTWDFAEVTFHDTSFPSIIYSYGSDGQKYARFQIKEKADSNCLSKDSLPIVIHAVPSPIISMVGSDLSSTTAHSYQWYLNDTLIPSATTMIWTPNQDGNYYVIATNIEGCEGKSNTISVTGVGLSESSNKPPLRIYPQPANSVLYIQGYEGIFSLYDIQGQHLLTDLNIQGKSIKVNDLKSGVYFLRLGSKMNSFIKIIVSH